MKASFLLRPDIVFLNHGSFGACPRPVFEVYQQWQRNLEAQPVEFLMRRFGLLLETARIRLAAYLQIAASDLVFAPNPTTAINIIARSLRLEPGDEILGTDHEYGAVDRTWRFVCAKAGATYRRQPIPLPISTGPHVVETFWQGVTPRTRAICLSQITSPTALIFPVKEICRLARQAGILTIIDGAHAPGHIPLDLDDLGADFYAGSCHKWLCAPKGSGFLFARPARQALLEPLVVSWGWESETPGPSLFRDQQEWQGTRDISAYLSVPAAIEFQAEHDWPRVQATCHALLQTARRGIETMTGLEQICPDSAEWYRQMASIPLPPCDTTALKERLWEEESIEIPLITWNGSPFIRVSIQAYNTDSDVERLLVALKRLLPQVMRPHLS